MENCGHDQKTLKFIQFGDGPALRGLVNEWMACIGKQSVYEGCAVFRPVSEEQKDMFQTSGRYCLYTTGIGKHGRAVKKEVRCMTSTVRPDEWSGVLQIASEEDLQCIMTDTTDEAPVSSKNDDQNHPLSLAGRVAAFLFARYQNNRKGISVFCFEPVQHNAKRLQLAVMALSIAWSLPEEFLKWVMEANFFIPCYSDRAIETAVEKKSGKPVLRVEGYGRIRVGDTVLPAFLQPFKAMGKDIETSTDAFRQFESDQYIWSMLLFSCALLSEALALPETNAPLYDPALRRWIGRMMISEYLPVQEAQEHLKRLADGMERLENEFYRMPSYALSINNFSFLCSNILSVIKSKVEHNEPCKGLILMLSLTVMESIRGKDKRFHALSSDMEPEALAYAVLSDEMLWGEDLRTVEGLEMMLASAIRDLQILGIRESILQMQEN